MLLSGERRQRRAKSNMAERPRCGKKRGHVGAVVGERQNEIAFQPEPGTTRVY